MKSIVIKVKKPKARVVWGFNPTTRTIKNKKAYSRSQNKTVLKNTLWA